MTHPSLQQPKGPPVIAIDTVAPWSHPGIIGSIPVLGPTLNLLYNWTVVQKLSYTSVGEFLADHLGPGGEMYQKRVGLLEDVGDVGQSLVPQIPGIRL